MGAQFNARIFHGSEAEVIKEFNTWVSNSQYENGHAGNYTGSISEKGKNGLIFPRFDKPFKAEDLAEDWLQENNGKWDDAMAVPFLTGEKIASASVNSKKRLEEKAKKLDDALVKLERQFLSELISIKSAYKSCRHCTSKIVKKHLKPECQVCGGDMYSETQRKRLQVAGRKSGEADRALRHWEPKKVTGKGVAYMVGGWCSS